ncbi:hypothetical protein F5Y11DRAFT_178969 [Daldinia sp. FL1419]|nr:hypothetical protein F5Y11DRAFT_178969 [Daldinia sp. FL1419]
MSWHSIDNWLECLDNTAAGTPSKKRGLVSPPMSDSTPAKKRRVDRRDGDDDVDLEDTPRQRQQRLPDSFFNTDNKSRSTPTPSLSSRSSANRSGHSSPSKQLSRLQLIEDGGIEPRPLRPDDPSFPRSLRTLLVNMSSAIGDGPSGIFHPSQREVLCNHFSGTWLEDQFRQHTLYHESRAELGPALAPEFVDDIVDQAYECDRYSYPENAWCQMVHYPLLRNTLQWTRTGQSNAYLDVIPCSTATIIPRYRVTGAPSKMVDYVVATEPTSESFRTEIKQLRRRTVETSINHTDYIPLLHRPIALSIEVKRTNDALDMAKLQLSVWLAAHWRKLDELCSLSSGQIRVPEFLLAIIIQGHDWYLVASTREDKNVIIWYKHALGTTSTAMGVFKIDWALRFIANHIRGNLWPFV